MFEKGARMKAEFGAENICEFSIGNPDVPPPKQFDKVLAQVAQDTSPGVHAYMPNGGYPFVREALAARISKEQNVTVSNGDLLMTCGAAGGMNIGLKAILNPGEEIIVLAPYFVDYCHYIENHAGVPKIINTDSEFNLDLGLIEKAISEKTRGIILNSPNNPSGQVYSRESLHQLGKLLSEASDTFGNSIFLLSDEPYRKLVFDGHEVPSIFEAYQNSMVVSSYSKDLSLPGERIGYLVVHPEIRDKAPLLDALTIANRILGFINAPALMQRVVAQVQDATVDISLYAKRKDLLCKVLKDAGLEFVEPKGAFYIFPKSPIEDDVKFVSMLVEEKILTVPGLGFGAPGYFRLAFCVPEETIVKAAEGFKRAVEKAKR